MLSTKKGCQRPRWNANNAAEGDDTSSQKQDIQILCDLEGQRQNLKPPQLLHLPEEQHRLHGPSHEERHRKGEAEGCKRLDQDLIRRPDGVYDPRTEAEVGNAKQGDGRTEPVDIPGESIENLARLVGEGGFVALYRRANNLLVPELWGRGLALGAGREASGRKASFRPQGFMQI